MGWIEFAGGLILALFVFVDVFSTVLVPRASHRSGRFGPMLASVLAPLWHLATRLLPSPRLRQNFRGSLGPFILVLSLVAWIAALALGFALMLHSQPQNVSLEHFGFGEALFQSALALSTLGMIHADINGSARAVVAIAGITGFAIVSLVVAFLLSIQSALHRREVLVLRLATRAGRPPAAITILRSMRSAGDEPLADLFGQWETWTAEVMQSHLSYPVLSRFRSLDEDMEWLVCLAAVLDAAALIVALDQADHPRARAAAAFLIGTSQRAVHEFRRLLGVRPQTVARDGAASPDLAAALAAIGYGNAAESGAIARFDTLRDSYAGALAGLARQLDIAWYETVLGSPPGTGTGGRREGVPLPKA